jgi:hypothetical protein
LIFQLANFSGLGFLAENGGKVSANYGRREVGKDGSGQACSSAVVSAESPFRPIHEPREGLFNRKIDLYVLGIGWRWRWPISAEEVPSLPSTGKIRWGNTTCLHFGNLRNILQLVNDAHERFLHDQRHARIEIFRMEA